MEGQGLNKNNKNSGFTILELLIAMIIVSIALIGLLRGIIEYNKFTTKAKMKDRAVEVLRTITGYIESLPYAEDGSGRDSILYANNDSWKNVTCDHTSCNILQDEDFYNLGLLNYTNPVEGISENLRLYPETDEITPSCACRGNHCPANRPACVYEGFAGKRIYAGVNIARIVTTGSEQGKIAAVIVWYFEPFTNRYQQFSSVVIKERR